MVKRARSPSKPRMRATRSDWSTMRGDWNREATIAELLSKSFAVWIIPHTYRVTALRERRVGDELNLEADLLGKYVGRLLADRSNSK